MVNLSGPECHLAIRFLVKMSVFDLCTCLTSDLELELSDLLVSSNLEIDSVFSSVFYLTFVMGLHSNIVWVGSRNCGLLKVSIS